MSNKYSQVIDEVKGKIELLNDELSETQKLGAKISKDIFSGLQSSGGNAKELQSQIDTLNKKLEKLNETKKKAISVDGQVKVKQSELAKSMIALNKQKEKEQRQTAIQTSRNKELNRAYNQLLLKQRQAKKTLQDLIVTQGRNARATRLAKKEYDGLTKKVNQANKATSNFSKTGLGSLARGLRNLVGAFGILGAGQIIASISKQVFSLTREINSLDFSMKTVIKDTQELAQTQVFLRQITSAFGADIVATTKRYVKFRAASKEANLTASETQKIFGTVTKAAGVLGLKTDELTGIYLALEQMISKGKVTTEELRRQLGERLPGAFDIMAQAIGVTTAELDDMLKKGEVLSAEALPKFVKALEKAYGIESVTKVDTMIAAQIRMNNAWKNFVISVENDGGKISTIFKTIFNDYADILEQVVKLNQTQGDLLNFNKSQAYQQEISKIEENWNSYINALIKAGKIEKEQANGEFLPYLKRLQKEQEQVVSNNSGGLQKLFALRQELLEVEKEIKLNKADVGRPMTRKIEIEDEIKILEIKERQNATDEGKLLAIKELIKLQNKEKIAEIKKKKDNKENEKFQKGSLAYYKNEIKLQEDKLKNLNLTKEEYDDITKKIGKAEIALDSYIRKTLGIGDVSRNFNLTPKGLDTDGFKLDDSDLILTPTFGFDEFNKQVEYLNNRGNDTIGLTKEQVAKLYKELKKLDEFKILKDIFKGSVGTFADFFDFDTSKLDFIFDSLADKSNELFSVENVGAWADFSKEAIGSVLNASLQRYDLELVAAQRQRDLIVNNDLATEEAKEAARQEFREKERRIQNERAKKERENTLISIAVDTAAGIVKAIAQTGTLAPFVIPSLVALGAAQAAVVASQPLPEFYKGVENSSYEGWATKDERGGEIQMDKFGNIKDWGQNKGSKLTYVDKGDTILNAQRTKSILDNFNGADIQKAVFEMNMSSGGEILNQNVVDKSLLNEIKGLKQSNNQVWSEVKKLANRKINVNNKVILKDERAY